MKTLYLLRHAKAAADNPQFDDHERALAGRGIEDAPKMAEALIVRGYVPDLILCSSARRAQESCHHILGVLGTEIPTRVVPNLYLATDETILSIVRGADGTANSVLVIGHNPGMEELASELGNQGVVPKFPTTAFAVFEFDVDEWKDVTRGEGRFVDFLTPSSLASRA